MYFFILGAGIGLVMQILTLIVQNTASYRDLGTATSGVTFFRTLGGSFGAAVLGSIYSNNLETALPAAVASTPGFPPSRGDQPGTAVGAAGRPPDPGRRGLRRCPAQRLPVRRTGRAAGPGGGLLPARRSPSAAAKGAGGTGEGFAIPEGADADTQLENIIGEVLRKKGSSAAPDVLAASGSSLDIPTSWGVMGIYLRYAITGAARQSSVETSVGVPPGVLRSFFDEIVADGYLTRDGDNLSLTAKGMTEVNLITTAWRNWLVEELREWLPDNDSEIVADEPAAPGRSTPRSIAS